ncbi:MAG: hypothetical protein HY841_09610 [Bacteroidetes bacterium]|nr:hypothetical protein [Bacteroidota bacterium]
MAVDIWEKCFLHLIIFVLWDSEVLRTPPLLQPAKRWQQGANTKFVSVDSNAIGQTMNQNNISGVHSGTISQFTDSRQIQKPLSLNNYVK